MKKIVVLSLALVMIVGMTGVYTYAYYTDVETSSGNQLSAGTLDLKTNDTDGVSQTLYNTDMSPGATVNSAALMLKNAGTINGATLDVVFSYEESDGSPNSVNKTADEVAAVMQVTSMTYDVTNLLGPLTDTNGNLYIDVQDLTSAANVASLSGLSGLNAGASKNFAIAVLLRSDVGNDFQADGINMTMTFTLNQ